MSEICPKLPSGIGLAQIVCTVPWQKPPPTRPTSVRPITQIEVRLKELILEEGKGSVSFDRMKRIQWLGAERSKAIRDINELWDLIVELWFKQDFQANVDYTEKAKEIMDKHASRQEPTYPCSSSVSQNIRIAGSDKLKLVDSSRNYFCFDISDSILATSDIFKFHKTPSPAS
jgi:hypothetical protein